ncbi:MAG: GNAT family N-acetyltransferase [Arcobacter sp.]|uniref:GNAT family N-acetyltransferase n=1 Tax=Arcobacter sp. TaxID=1872629 RepID=UPI003B00F596
MNKKRLIHKNIREANINDIDDLSKLSNSLLAFLFEQTPPKWFVDELSTKAFEKRVLGEVYEDFVYIKDEKIVGLLTIKDKNQIFHLFVDSKYHKGGIAKKLWEFTKANYEIKNMKVNASLYAIKVYESFGFIKEGKQKEFKGLKYQPMIYKG